MTETSDCARLACAKTLEAVMTVRRNRRKQTTSFAERLQKAAREAREAAGQLPEGSQRDVLLKKAGQAETAWRINEWLTSPGPRSLR
jgi:hypothetical protein